MIIQKHTLGSNVRYYRKRRYLTQMELQALSGYTCIGMIESGHRVNPRLPTLQAIAKALRVTVSDLYSEEAPRG